MYHVKWVGYPETESTKEPEENIPGFIRRFYEDTLKLGSKLPAPTIKHTKTIAGVKHHYLKWGEAEGDWLSEDFFKIMNEDVELVETHEPECNTRKSRDKRVKRHTVGLLVGASPCGVVRLVEELFGCEAISQVYGIVAEYLGKLSKQDIEVLVYDDICHLVAFALNHIRLKRNTTTEYFNSLKFAIDKFHFKNHVDAYCHENYNPRKLSELDCVNTVVCEHLFKDINSYKNCKSMNEAHFFIFFFYNMDLHNLRKEGLISITNPDSHFRKDQVNAPKIEEVDFKSLNQLCEPLVTNLPFNCPLCSCGYETEGGLNKHINSKHPETNPNNPRACAICDKILSSEQRLKTHLKTHLICKLCKEEFKSNFEMLSHKKDHTTCKNCKKDFLTESKLKQHGKCKK